MSARSEQAAVVAAYTRMVEELNQQAAVLHGGVLAPVVKFLEGHQRLAEQALRELDATQWEQEQADAIRGARYGDVLAQER